MFYIDHMGDKLCSIFHVVYTYIIIFPQVEKYAIRASTKAEDPLPIFISKNQYIKLLRVCSYVFSKKNHNKHGLPGGERRAFPIGKNFLQQQHLLKSFVRILFR